MSSLTARLIRWLVIILLGNGLYFALWPYLPPAARHQGFRVDAGTLVDFWLCLIVFGIFELATFLGARHKTRQGQDRHRQGPPLN
jgi:hypothetical protein